MTDSDEEFIDINTVIKNNNEKDHNTVYNNYSNFSEVIRENNENLENKEKYLYQPQFNKNLCELKIVGYSEDTNNIKIGEFPFLDKKITLVGHIYKYNEINSKNFFDIISLVLNKKEDKFFITFRFNVLERNNNFLSGDFDILFIYKEDNIEKSIKLNKLDYYPGNNKIIENLINELSNPIIIDKYDY